MIGGQYVLITSAIPDEIVSSVVCVNLGYRFEPNVHFFLAYEEKGIRSEHLSSVGRRFGILFVGSDAFPSLGKMTLDDFIGGRSLLGRVREG